MVATGQVAEPRLFLLATKVGKGSEAGANGAASGAKTSRVEFSLK
jgi:hypothetical protein